ncbi:MULTISPECIES: phosphate signaling complex protein PhoU [unclassified Breznakia]|uniref:phosphate signaling complex protein PhoU n=1 Tax=unclassified Breznakia TaxID=2623764 RepID=UPI002473C3C0|nr:MULTISPECIES: phosphate signaling complex protein PhoU [unclassified Breznakia]MDH6366879.1 phosphate transport system protein [Breznakia sp. PH1-1]MDH6404057.1 phosphate transport system protein [Breznakia sp. PF1-11]MDH6411721.1 phosphate transport system protein [Breznakia sp. PFB1-11]MDH6414045.1 phosphate transport system protein [Breznakia sp. PFB1-14]MDH6416475.1 phosphate transport system protein [Breznakia sp. PFB1-4]
MLKLDRKLVKLETSVRHMGRQVIEQHKNCEVLFEHPEKSLARQVMHNDEIINNYETNINEQAIADIVLLRPIATDLRRVIVAIKIASDLERIGDYAKSMAKFVIKNLDNPATLKILKEASFIQQRLVKMLEDIMIAYKQKDVSLAYEIPTQDKELEALLQDFRKIVIKNNVADLEDAFNLSALYRTIGRSSDHAVNICEHIVYLCKGIQYDFDKEE